MNLLSLLSYPMLSIHVTIPILYVQPSLFIIIPSAHLETSNSENSKIFKFSKWASIKLSKRQRVRISKVNKCANFAFEENLTKIPNIESLEVYTFFRYSNPNGIVSQLYIGRIP